MRILVITNMYPPHHLGGYEQLNRDCVVRWVKHGHEVKVLATTLRFPWVDQDDDPSAEVRRELEFYWADDLIISPPPRRRLAIERNNQKWLKRTLDEFRPDVVSLWHMGAMSMGLITTLLERQIPTVFCMCDDWLIYGPNVDAWMRVWRRHPRLAPFVRALSGVPTTLPKIGPSEPFCFMSDWLRQRALTMSVLNVETTTLVYGGIDAAEFPAETRPARPWEWRLLCVGRQEERKGTHIALGAMGALPEQATLDIVGPTAEAYGERLREMAQPYGERVRFDIVPRSELAARYAAADVFLFPVTWDEPFGIVPLEAMACSTPVIATGTGGSAEYLVDGRNCLLVPRSDEQALTAAIRRLADDAALRARLVDGGLRTARELTIDRFSDAIERWHVAAHERYANGRPPDLPPPDASLEPT